MLVVYGINKLHRCVHLQEYVIVFVQFLLYMRSDRDFTVSVVNKIHNIISVISVSHLYISNVISIINLSRMYLINKCTLFYNWYDLCYYLRVFLGEQRVKREHFRSGNAHASTTVAGRRSVWINQRQLSVLFVHRHEFTRISRRGCRRLFISRSPFGHSQDNFDLEKNERQKKYSSNV